MSTVQVVGTDEIAALIRGLPSHLFEATKTAMGASTLRVHAKVSSFSGGLKIRSGVLRRSLKTEAHGSRLRDLGTSVYSDVVYAPIHEHGGTIKAKKAYLRVPGGPYLNIPLSANMTPAGVTRQSARTVFSTGGYIIKSKIGNYIVMSRSNQPMFVLKKQVTIPARLGMQEAAEDEVPVLLNSLRTSLLNGI